jgi:hypothetical protein
MKTKLDQLLESIDPARTLDQVSARVDEAVNSFPGKSAAIKDWKEFTSFMAKFFRHAENIILRIRPAFSGDPAYNWSRCCHLLIKEFGNNGEKVAFERAQTGTEGGLYGVLKAVARQMADEYAGNEIGARIAAFWNALSIQEQLAVPKEYLAKFGHLLPPELTSRGAAKVLAFFPKVLEEHPRIVKRLRSIGRG